MHHATSAYAKTAQKTANPRELEAQLLLKAAAKLQSVVDGFTVEKAEVLAALQFNRKLWTILLGSITDPGHPLPHELRQNLANLGVFSVSHALALELTPEPERMKVLVNINRCIAEGLRS